MGFEQLAQIATSATELDDLFAEERFDRIVHPLVEFGRLFQGIERDSGWMGIVGAKPKPEGEPERGQPVAPADFFAFLVGAAIVAHRNFINAEAIARDLGCNFWLNAEPIGLEW